MHSSSECLHSALLSAVAMRYTALMDLEFFGF